MTLAAGGLAVLVLSAAVYLAGLASNPFYTKGEPREALVVWEMAHGSGFVLPLRNGVEIPSKPPFFHWLAYLAAAATGGVSELAMRLPSAILATIATLAVYVFGATTGRIRSGWLAAVALMFSFEWLRAARTARVDMTLTFFLFAALLCFAVIDRRGVTRFRLFVFYACIAAATLGKGPVGIVLPALVIAAYAAASPVQVQAGAEASASPHPSAELPPDPRGARMRRLAADLRARARNVGATLRRLEPARGVLAVLVVVGIWYLAALGIGGREFFVKHVLKENVYRVLDPARLDTGHLHGPLYLVPQFLLGALPWSLLAPALLWWLWRMRPFDATTRYLVVWFVVVFLFFSISASKRSVYLLPAYPAAALLLGRILGPGPEDEGPRRLAAWGLMIVSAALCLGALVSLSIASGLPVERLVMPFLKPKDQQGVNAAFDALRGSTWPTVAAAMVVLGGAVATAITARGAHWLRASVTLSAALLALYAGVVGPIESSLAETRTLKPFMASVNETTGGDQLGFFCTFDYGAVFYSGRRITPGPNEKVCRDDTARIDALREVDGPKYVLLWEDQAARDASDLQILLHSEGTGPKGRARMVLAKRTTDRS